MFFAASSIAFGQKYVGWSTGYLTAWAQADGYSPDKVRWKSYTHMCQFSMIPNSTGLGWEGGLNDTLCKAFVAGCHKNNTKAIICIGGYGFAANFKTAFSSANRAKFIAGTMSFIAKYGYDGADVDWEESIVNADFSATMKDLRTALNTLTPKGILTAAMGDWNSAGASLAGPYSDQCNGMAYWTTAGSAMDTYMNSLISKGVAKTRLGVGMGYDYTETPNHEIDCDPTAVRNKCLYAINSGYGGVMTWAIEMDETKYGKGKTPCQDTLAHYVNKATTFAWQNSDPENETPKFSLVCNGVAHGFGKISYCIPASEKASFVDLGIYSVNGALVKTLVQGQCNPGVFTIPFEQASSGTYFIKLSVNSKTSFAKATMVK